MGESEGEMKVLAVAYAIFTFGLATSALDAAARAERNAEMAEKLQWESKDRLYARIFTLEVRVRCLEQLIKTQKRRESDEKEQKPHDDP